MSEEPAEPADVATYLDLLLTDASLGMVRRFRPDGSMARFGLRLASRPQQVTRRMAGLAKDLGEIAAGRSQIAPPAKDRRFADRAWTANPLLRRLVQAYLATGTCALALVDDADLGWRDAERVGFVVRNLVDAAAPSNNPLISPEAWKAVIDTGGRSVPRGLRALAADLAAPPRVPSMVSPDAFEVGRDLAVTPGAVVRRTEICELIQYAPAIDQVHQYPVLIVPPTINKYYITDLAPGRSMVEFLVSQGHQVFAISWRNPDARYYDWGLDAYGQAVVESLDAARAVCGAAKASVLALCSGGIIALMVAAHLRDAGRLDSLASLFLGVTVLDQGQDGTTAALADERTVELAVALSRRRGYLDGRSLAEVFAWLRPNDLIWSYWVNNYLRGEKPAPFDILYWNADTTRLPARLHRDFIDVIMGSALAKRDAATMLGSPVDLSAVDVDAYVLAGSGDHLCPWQSCYRSAQLLGGDVRFVLSSSGHIASMVNPPGNRKTRFQVAAEPLAGWSGPTGCSGPTGKQSLPGPDDWLHVAGTVAGSWWPDYSSWLAERGGGVKDAPAVLGAAKFPPLDPAPGRYVFDR